jgi:type 1 fimbria pilin
MSTSNILIDATITVSRNMPAGQTIKQYTVTNSGTNKISNCDKNGKMYNITYKPLTSAVPVSGQPGVYETGLRGIGYKIETRLNDSYINDGADWHLIDGTVTAHDSTYNTSWAPYYYPEATYRLSLVTTNDPIDQGSFTQMNGQIAQVLFDSTVTTSLTVSNASAVVVKSISCNTASNVMPLNLGKVSVDDANSGVGKVFGTQPFSLVFNCDPGVKVTGVLAGVQDPNTSDSSVFALDAASHKADGVGVQFSYKLMPIKSGVPFVIGSTNPGTGTVQLPFNFETAYFQTKSTVTAGTANATVVMNLTYE